MRIINRFGLALLLVAGLALTACSGTAPAAGKVKPATIVKVDGSEFSKVVLTEKASQRLGLETDKVREEIIDRAITVAGVVVDPQKAAGKISVPAGKALVEAFVSESDLGILDQEEEVQINSLDDENGAGLPGEIIDDLDLGDQEDTDSATLYYLADNTGNTLQIGQKVLIDIALKGNGTLQKIVPYQAVIYGVKGETWVYTNPEPLVYIRQPIQIDFIDEDMVVLKDGPTPGTRVVTVGVAELFGAETGVSK